MVDFTVAAHEPLVLVKPDALDDMDMMSPFIWREDGALCLMARALPRGPDAPTGIIWAGHGDDGIRFVMDPAPALIPGPDPADIGGGEDPTVMRDDVNYRVYYTGVEASRTQGSLLVAEGPSLDKLVKREVALAAPPGQGNIKEATMGQAPDGSWRLFFEFAVDNASRIGVAAGPTQRGPWTRLDDPFTVRDGGWDNWHLSTGPMLQRPGRDPVMFYNGATRDARWRIGWVSFSPDFTKVTGRSVEPLISPPPEPDRLDADIAFAASCVDEADDLYLYYSLEDRMLMRARLNVY